MVVVFASQCHVFLFMMIGLPQFTAHDFAILAVYDQITEKQAKPALTAALQFVNDIQQFSFNLSHAVIRDDINLTLEKIFHQCSAVRFPSKQTVLIINSSESGVTISLDTLYTNEIDNPTIFNPIKNEPEINKIHIVHPNRILTTKLQQFILSQHLSSIAIIHDENFDEEMWTNLTVYQLSLNKAIIRNHLMLSQSSNESSIILMGSFLFINTALKLASTLDVFRNSTTVYAFSKEKLDHLHRPCNTSLIILEVQIHNKMRLNDLKLKYPELANNSEIDNFFYFEIGVASLLASSKFVNTDFKHLSRKSNLDLLLTIKKEISFLSPAFGVFYMKNSKLHQNFTLKINPSIDRENRQQTNTLSRKTRQAKSNFEVREYRVLVAEFPPFIFKHASGYSGYCIDLLQKLSEKLRFSYTLHESTYGDLPEVGQNHTWTGVIRELMDKRADFLLAPMSIMRERERVVDFTIPFYDAVGITILMRRPSASSSLFQFLTVFEKNVWGCVLAAYFLTSFLLCLFERFSPYSYQNNKIKYGNSNDDKRIFTLSESLWFCIISLTPLGGGEAPTNVSGKIVVAAWWLFGFIVIVSYTANLAAYLTVSRNDVSIKHLDELYKQHKIKYAPVNGSVSMTYFSRMAHIEKLFHNYWTKFATDAHLDEEDRARIAVWEYPISDKFTKMWQIMKETGFPRTIGDGLRRVREEDFALLGEKTEFEYENLRDCNLMVVGEEFSRKPYAIAVQKGSVLKKTLSLGLLELQSERVLEDLKEKWWKTKKYGEKCYNENSALVGISIRNNGGVFCVVLIGTGFAGLTLLFEYLWYRNGLTKPPPRVTNVVSLPIRVGRKVKTPSGALRKKPLTPPYSYHYSTNIHKLNKVCYPTK